MSDSKETLRLSLYADLNKFIPKESHEKILKTSNKILYSFHDDIKAFHCKILSLIFLSRFDEVITAFSKYPEYHKTFVFEKVYTLYRLNKVVEALELLESTDRDSLPIKELEAQILYRLERFEDCYERYRNIIKSSCDEYDDERETNLIAIIANIGTYGKVYDLPAISHKTHEVLYNMACFLMASKQFERAEATLNEAEKFCLESFDEDATQEEIDEEVNLIKCQLACCAHFLGREKEALSSYKSLLQKKPSDNVILAVVSNNSLAINRGQNVFDSKKKMKTLQSDSVLMKLTTLQKKSISVNINQLLVFNSQDEEQAIKICDSLLQQYPDSLETAVLLKASVYIKYKKLSSAKTLLEKYMKEKKLKLKMCLALAQIYLNEGMYKEACTVFQSLGEDMFKPGIVSALVTIMIAMGNVSGASEVLQKAVDWNKKTERTDSDLSALWRHAANLHLCGGQPQLAAYSLEQLLNIDPRNTTVLAQLTIAYAQFDPQKASRLSEQLPHLIDLTPDLDVDYLETSSWMMGLKTIKKVAKMDQSPGTPFMQKKKSHNKKKRKRLPKNYDPNSEPDPERWLPRRERANYRKKKDRRNREIGKGTQGAVGSNSSDQFDITKMTSAQKTGGQTAASLPEASYKDPQRKMQYKKKKKTGKK